MQGGGFFAADALNWIGFSPHCFLEILPGFSPQCSLEIGFSLLCRLCTMEWSSPCPSCRVRCQVSLLWQARPHTQHNGARGETIPWHQGLGWQISTIFYWTKISCSTDHILVTHITTDHHVWVYDHHWKIMLYIYCGQEKSDIICHPRP